MQRTTVKKIARQEKKDRRERERAERHAEALEAKQRHQAQQTTAIVTGFIQDLARLSFTDRLKFCYAILFRANK